MFATASSGAHARPVLLAKTASWLETVNFYRAQAGLVSIAENPEWNDDGFRMEIVR